MSGAGAVAGTAPGWPEGVGGVSGGGARGDSHRRLGSGVEKLSTQN